MKKNNLLGYNDYQKLALQDGLSRHEKIGGPNYVREGYTNVILKDILKKIPLLKSSGLKIADIGCGCDDLSIKLAHYIVKKNNKLWLLDSAEMLALMPEHKNINKIKGEFPYEHEEFINSHKGCMDIIMAYSVIQCICTNRNVFNFIDLAIEMLVPGGKLLLGDLNNRSKRRRFFSSNEGIKTHKKFTGTDELPKVNPWETEYGQLDDSIIFAIMQRYRNGGHETYLLPQGDSLPFANRREDILIVKHT